MKSTTKKQKAFAALRKAILDGSYRAEDFPSERTLMARFDMSRGLVREILRELRFAGFLEVRPKSGYTVSRMARNLGGVIGLIVPGASDDEEIFAPICKEFTRIAQRNGYGVLLDDVKCANNHERMNHVKSLVKDFLRQRVSGVIMQPVMFTADSPKINAEIVDAFHAADIPVVLGDYDIVLPPDRSGYDLVCIDNLNAGRAVARHMIEQGAKRIVFLMCENWAFSVHDRLTGCHSVAAEAGVPVAASNVLPTNKKGIAALLAGDDAPDAFICGNDFLAAQLLQTLKDIGRRVPEDVMVAGFDDVRLAVHTSPPLTTVHQPCASIARTLFETLQSRIKDFNADSRSVLFNAPLVVRESTLRMG